MEVMNVLLLMAYLIVAAVMVWIVLVQEPKTTGGDLMGGGTDLFAARGVTGGMYRLTVWLGIIFAALALLIGMVPR